MNIGDAVKAMKAGKRVCREGWNGKGMWIAVTAATAQLESGSFWNPSNKEFAESNGGFADVESTITMKTARDTIQMGWSPTVSDTLADDWAIYSDPLESKIDELKLQLLEAVTEEQKMFAMGIAETLGIDLDAPNETEQVA